ncbi:MAG: DUF4835 family protein [Saprospiraceae bacterium]|nr:DUF4835 family protein [Saprospiraceae bacterium]
MNKLFSLIVIILITQAVIAQEFDFKVSIVTPKLQIADPKVFDNMSAALKDMINSQKWTDDIFEPNERIKGNIVITIKEEQSANAFTADFGIQAVRPVYGSNYETPIFTHLDKDVPFTYEIGRPLFFSNNNYVDNLTSVIGFYAYIIIGLDYDTFSPLGGDQYFQRAQDIVNTVPSGSPGWSVGEQRSRYQLIENLLNPRVKAFRQSMYDYNRLGLDIMAQDPAKGRQIIEKALDKASELSVSYPNCMILQVFANTKRDEIVEIFKEADRGQKTKVYLIMSKVDPSNAPKYRQIGI